MYHVCFHQYIALNLINNNTKYKMNGVYSLLILLSVTINSHGHIAETRVVTSSPQSSKGERRSKTRVVESVQAHLGIELQTGTLGYCLCSVPGQFSV